MSDSGEKTEQPTPKKERDAREKGQVAKSTEVVTTVSLAATVGFVWANGANEVAAMARMFDIVANLYEGDFRANASAALDAISREVVGIVAPLLLVVIVAGVASNYLQTGSVFAFESIAPKLEKISPGAGFKKIFSMKALVELGKSSLKIVILSVLLYSVVKESIGAYVVSLSCGMPCIGAITQHVLMKIFSYAFLAFIVVAGADFMYQRHSHTKSLMMSKEEVKREFKESEGDPHVKGHRKQVAFEMIMGDDGEAKAKKGSALVVNPTHLAVVIAYDKDEIPLPVVTAKGREREAVKMRAAAERSGVPVFRNAPLARALYATTAVNETVPDELFDAIAEVITWVNKNRELLYNGPLERGVIDMEQGDHRAAT